MIRPDTHRGERGRDNHLTIEYTFFKCGGDVILHVSVASRGVWGHAPQKCFHSTLYEIDSDTI